MKKNISNLLCLFIILISSEIGVGVGVVLDVDSLEVGLGLNYLSIAHNDFYSKYQINKTRLVFLVGDSNGQITNAADSELELRKELKLKASQVSFLIEMGNKAQEPIVYLSATSPLLFTSPNKTPSYLIQKSQTESTHIGATVKAFQGLQVFLVFEDTDYGLEIPSRGKRQFLKNCSSIKQADQARNFGLLAYDILWERVATSQQTLASFGHFSESFNSTNPFTHPKLQTGPKLFHVIFTGRYNELVNEIILRNIDKAVGDTAIRTNMYLPCDDKWRFLKPLTRELWFTSIALFILTGAALHTAGENGRDENRLEYFSMIKFDPRHAREILECDEDGEGGGGGGGGGYRSASGDQILELDTGPTGGRQRWWKKVWRLLKQTTQHL